MEIRIWRGSNMFLALRVRIICKIHNSSCSERENIHKALLTFRASGTLMQFVWPHEIAKNKMFRSMLLPKKVQEIHQKAAQILPNYTHNGNYYKDIKLDNR